MAGPLHIFVSHSSDDAQLAQAVDDRLRLIPGLAVDIDMSGLEAGKPWRRQLHEWMARCGAALVLLTPAVLQRPKWVLKESIILGWRLDLEPRFSLFFVLAPGVTRKDFESSVSTWRNCRRLQLIAGEWNDITDLDSLMVKLQKFLPAAQPVTPFDELITAVTQLLRVADQQGATYQEIATYLGITDVPNWGPISSTCSPSESPARFPGTRRHPIDQRIDREGRRMADRSPQAAHEPSRAVSDRYATGWRPAATRSQEARHPHHRGQPGPETSPRRSPCGAPSSSKKIATARQRLWD